MCSISLVRNISMFGLCNLHVCDGVGRGTEDCICYECEVGLTIIWTKLTLYDVDPPSHDLHKQPCNGTKQELVETKLMRWHKILEPLKSCDNNSV